MSKTILSKVNGWTPVINIIVKDVGLMSAVVFGRMWRFCQMEDGVCKASLEKISEEIGIDRATVMRHAKDLCDAGYLKDLTPDLRNRPHVYADTGKASLEISITVAESNTTVAERNVTVAESKLNKDSKKEEKIKTLSERKKEAEERKAKQRAAKGDIVDLFIQVSPALQEQTLMRQRVENALHRNLDWDSARSPWNGYEKKLVRREKENGQTIEGFMEWFNSDEFRKKGVIYLNPTKIEDWWLQAFETTLSYDEQLAKAGYK